MKILEFGGHYRWPPGGKFVCNFDFPGWIHIVIHFDKNFEAIIGAVRIRANSIKARIRLLVSLNQKKRLVALDVAFVELYAGVIHKECGGEGKKKGRKKRKKSCRLQTH